MVSGGGRLAPAGQDVEDDVGASGRPRAAPRAQAASTAGRPSLSTAVRIVDHLPVAVVAAGQLAPDPLQAGGSTQSLNGAPLRSAPGLRASTGT